MVLLSGWLRSVKRKYQHGETPPVNRTSTLKHDKSALATTIPENENIIDRSFPKDDAGTVETDLIEQESQLVAAHTMSDNEVQEVLERQIEDFVSFSIREDYIAIEDVGWEIAAGDDAAVPLVAEAMSRTRDPFIKEQFGNVLAKIGTQKAVSELIWQIKSENDPERRAELSRALQLLNQAAQGAVLFEEIRTMDFETLELQMFGEAFSRLADANAVDLLVQELEKSDIDAERMGYYQYLLITVRNEKAIPSLSEVVLKEGPVWYQGEAAMALARIGTPEAVASILKGIDQEDVRDYEHPLIIALKNVQNPEALSLMADLVASAENEVVQHAAATVLALAGSEAWDPVFSNGSAD